MAEAQSAPAGTEQAAAILNLWKEALSNLSTAVAMTVQSQQTLPQAKTYDMTVLVKLLSDITSSVIKQPDKVFELQAKVATDWMGFWMDVWSPPASTEKPKIAPAKGDRRFRDAEYNDNPYFRSVRDYYLLASDHLRNMVNLAEAEDDSNKAMMGFLLDQYLNAVAPTNFAVTNPEALRRISETGGANLVSGFANMLQDFAEGKGIVRRRTSDYYVKGKNIAATPGSVVFQNDLFQLLQYTPQTPDVHKRPMLYVPPLVNKYYLIDLEPKSSLVRWLVEQGRTVFVISWVNPDDKHRHFDVENYVLEGIVEAIGAVEKATGEKTLDLFSFCLGGTLAAMALAYLAGKKQSDRVGSLTTIGTLVDFKDMRGWSAFVNEAHLDALDEYLEKKGYIESSDLQRLFSAVRSNDLIWNSVVNHYLLDKEVPPSDLLYWFEDGARIPQSFLTSYNRKMLHANTLSTAGAFEIDGVKIDISKIKQPIASIALKDDHVCAWDAVYTSAKLLSGAKVEYILGGSGHNAGLVNPPSVNKHGYWTHDGLLPTADEWLAAAEKHEGSWWPYWEKWLTKQGDGSKVPARKPGDGALKVIEPAPGSYANMRY